MPPAGFEPTISAGERPQSYALDRAATGTGHTVFRERKLDFVPISYIFRPIWISKKVHNNLLSDSNFVHVDTVQATPYLWRKLISNRYLHFHRQIW